MLEKIIRFSIRNKLVIAILTVLLVVWGLWSASRLPIDAVPDITDNQVQVITTASSLAAQEVEQYVTFPIEQSLSNLPGLKELRSISRFGLSVVTAVFEDDVDIYFARQLMTERLSNVQDDIPEGIAKPELGPVSTGLGEVYQYTIHPRQGSEHKYTAMDLRTMQDWIVARQLYGTPGVAEVNSFGGFVKQYEVAIDPNRLKALNLSIAEVFAALEKNNQNTGGAYIDKKPLAYFIRGIGVLTSLEDVGRIIIKQVNGIPVLISDVATPKFGHAIRFGAMSYNGEHEVVGGIVMMLKGSNSAEVVKRVKERMADIQKTLPADVEITAFLDRTNLVNRAIGTVEENLVLGALIVIFVLVLFLGNIRAGLIVASAIPLSLLFALGMMNLFGVSANLMSLGAIDFGLIVDGAVIIVEATLFHLGITATNRKLTRAEMDEEVLTSASAIMKSAVFGMIIILIVYIPILTLVGIEGKMFRPMAQTVSFAILGALILSLTYIPMMSARFLPRTGGHKRNLSDKMIDALHRWYEPVLHKAIQFKYAVVAVAVALLLLVILLFTRMGSEFIPQLQEGDYAFHCILPQGTSLLQSVETSMQASRIIRSFPEVEKVVGKTGSAEVPTDMMPPEATDMIIVLKPKREWVTTKDYNQLAQMIYEKLQVIPGVIFEVNQPIQMRFNELMTGIRQDVAVKVFGENIDTLAAIAPKVAAIISTVKGATEPQVERISGLPQITITYDRSRIAGYGMNIEEVNRVVSTAFAGQSAGVVFENERRFDLVVRLDSAHRSSINDVADLYIPTPNSAQVPLSQVAKVQMKEGPAQISREDAKRRIVIGFNVQGRDVQSVVEEIQSKLAATRLLPDGYYYTYGGTFENLQHATSRLLVAVPVALLLIFVLLYFAFKSIKQALLIYTAIPMSAIGGVLALLARDMPFSISAGVGFIALFGVAVLNGIVLISRFNQLKKEGMTDPVQRVMEGTRTRLRPVLMTAMVASLGFLPMALSGGAGAEVQRPLATVVIGGLITATLLTLILLPLLYIIFTKKKRIHKAVSVVAIMFTCIISTPVFAQQPTVRTTFDAVYDSALRNNLQLRAADVQLQQARTFTGTWSQMPKTGIFIENEDLRPNDQVGILKIGLSQSVEWPTVYTARRKLYTQQSRAIELNKMVQAVAIKRDVQDAYYTLWYLQNKQQLMARLDSIYTSLTAAARLKVRTGESAGLDSISAIARSREIAVQVKMINRDMAVQQEVLRQLTNTSIQYLPDTTLLEKVPVALSLQPLQIHPQLQWQQQQQAIAEAQVNVQQQAFKPEFSGRFFSQRLYGISNNPFTGFSVSIGVPLLGRGAMRKSVAAARLESDYQQAVMNRQAALLNSEYLQAVQELKKDEEMLAYYETTGLREAEAILQAAQLAYRAGEISFADLSQFITQAIDIQRNYLDVLNKYNHSAIRVNYFLNQ